jgi:5-methylcytosine-specific restriction endonuclease McrA
MCKVNWCINEPLKYKNGAPKAYCGVHMQYKQYAANAPVRPWLMYKVEKVVKDNLKCEHCGFEPYATYPNEDKKRLISLMDVDHINPQIKHTPEGEQPSNYQLLCKHCHILKSHEEGDFKAKKYR